MQTKSNGRTLAVLFICDRCKSKAVLPYDECMKGETYDYLHNSTLPDGWAYHGGYNGPMLCPDCEKRYQDFMNMKKEV